MNKGIIINKLQVVKIPDKMVKITSKMQSTVQRAPDKLHIGRHVIEPDAMKPPPGCSPALIPLLITWPWVNTWGRTTSKQLNNDRNHIKTAIKPHRNNL